MLIREGWLHASVNLAEARVRSATLLLAALSVSGPTYRLEFQNAA